MLEVDFSDRIAKLCRAVAERTGDGRLRTAAAILTGKHSGRKATDDTRALEYAEGLFKTGVARSLHRACERAAQLYAPAHQIDTMRDRLRKKLRRQLDKSEAS